MTEPTGPTEAIRHDRAESLEGKRVDRAADLEGQRVNRAADLETDRADRADVVEGDRVYRAKTAEANRTLRASRVQKQLWFMMLFLLAAFVLLAYRTEVNDNNLRSGFYEACTTRQQRTIQSNVGREILVQLATHGPNSPKDPAAKAKAVKQLRDGLILPVEDCGAAP